MFHFSTSTRADFITQRPFTFAMKQRDDLRMKKCLLKKCLKCVLKKCLKCLLKKCLECHLKECHLTEGVDR